MYVHSLKPDRALKDYICRYVYCKIGTDDGWTSSSMAPLGYPKLAIVLETDQILAKENGSRARNFAPITFVGQITHYIPFSWYGKLKVFFVIFQPCGAFPLLDIHQEECKNLPLSLSNLMGSSAQYFEERLTDKLQAGEVKKIIDRFFLQRISFNSKKKEQRKYQSKRLTEAVKQIQLSSHISPSIKEICKKTGYSLSTLERRMKKIVGITPKQLQRIMRFNKMMEFINQNPSSLIWSRIAQQFGYYDQTHFIKEFKHFYGKTPAKYTTEDNRFLSNVALQKKACQRPIAACNLSEINR